MQSISISLSGFGRQNTINYLSKHKVEFFSTAMTKLVLLIFYVYVEYFKFSFFLD